MNAGRHFALAFLLLAASGCYHQVVQTGRTPGPTVVHQPWTPTFLWGLIPPAPIDVSAQCRSGIATVETQETVPNWFVTLLTLGIYAPRDVKVTCATGSAMLPGRRLIEVAGTAAALDTGFQRAVKLSSQTGEPVVVRFTLITD